MHANRERLLGTFLRLAAFDSPAVHKGALASAVRSEPESLAWRVSKDGTGPDIGNLACRRARAHSLSEWFEVELAYHVGTPMWLPMRKRSARPDSQEKLRLYSGLRK
jgi:hypothetical protein